MCISAQPAQFKGTRILVAAQKDGTHIVFYDCKAKSGAIASESSFPPAVDETTQLPEVPLMEGSSNANAMILLIPRKKGTEIEVIDTEGAETILQDLSDSCRTLEASFSLSSRGAGVKGTFRVTETGIFHVVTADSASQILEGIASDKVPVGKKADVSRELLEGLEKKAPDYAFAVACFNNNQSKRAAPVGIQYTPALPDYFVFPALDGHDGNAPTDEDVGIDHELFAGAVEGSGLKAINGVEVQYKYTGSIRHLLPKHVTYRKFPEGTKMPNGDFVISVTDALNFNWGDMRRMVCSLV